MTVIHLDSNHPALIEQLDKAGYKNIVAYEQSPNDVLKNGHLYNGIVIRSRFRISKELMDGLPNLKFIARVGAGVENIDVDYARKAGIKLFSAPEGNRSAVAEHTLGLILSLFNKLNQADRQVRDGLWFREANRGIELEGKTVGIIGYGNMGKALAKRLKGFDVTVIFHDILQGLQDDNAQQVPLDELKRRSDLVSLHTPWTPETDRMVDSTFIDSFSKPFWFFNTARGRSVVTADLVKGLLEQKILGAGLDVLEFEKSSFENLFHDASVPEALQELLIMDNVLLTPHVAGWTIESHKKLADTISKKVIGHFGRFSS